MVRRFENDGDGEAGTARSELNTRRREGGFPGRGDDSSGRWTGETHKTRQRASKCEIRNGSGFRTHWPSHVNDWTLTTGPWVSRFFIAWMRARVSRKRCAGRWWNICNAGDCIAGVCGGWSIPALFSRCAPVNSHVRMSVPGSQHPARSGPIAPRCGGKCGAGMAGCRPPETDKGAL